MYKRLSKVFISTISIFSITLGETQVFANEKIVNESSNKKVKSTRLRNLSNKVVVTSESELLKALDNESINEILLQGNVIISNNIDFKLKGIKRDIKLIIGSSKFKNSSLVISKGVEINGNGKLTIIKENNENTEIINFIENQDSLEFRKTILKNLNIIGKNGQVAINNNIDELDLENINIKDCILFKNIKNENQKLYKVNFVNSSIGDVSRENLKITEESLISDSTSIYLSGTVSSSDLDDSYSVIAIDDKGNVIESKKVMVDKQGNLKALISGLSPGVEYKIHIVKFNNNDLNSNYFLSNSCRFKTLDFKSMVDSVSDSGAKIKVTKHNINEKYYPLYFVLKHNGEEFKRVEIKKHNTKNSIVFNVTGLMENSKFSYEFISYINGNEPMVIDKGEFETLSSVNKEEVNSNNQSNNNSQSNSNEEINQNVEDNKNQEIDKENSDSEIGEPSSSILVYTIAKDYLNSPSTVVKDTSIKINLSDKILNSIKNPIVIKSNVKNMKVKIENGKLVLDNLIPGKDYSEVKVFFQGINGKQVILSLSNFKTIEETTNLNKFVKNVYFNAFNRNPDESGFLYWTTKLSKGEITPEVFIKNLLNEHEFLKIRPTTESKIEGLYKVIVNRVSDKDGLSFWTELYNSYYKDGNSDELALNNVVDKMMESKEFKHFINTLKIKKP